MPPVITAPTQSRPGPWSPSVKWAIAVGSGLLVWSLPMPAGVTASAWRMLAIFTATIAAVIARPVPTSVSVLLGLTVTMLTHTLTIEQALAGYSNPIIWLPVTAFLMARAMINTGLGRRVAFLFIRALGSRSLGLAYAFACTDLFLGTFIPSNGARAGGVLFPIVKSLSQAYDSEPGPTARRLGAFLLQATYQADVVVCAMFLTGQASNPLIAEFAHKTAGIELTYARWALIAAVPGLISLVTVPYLLFKIFPPEVKSTPDAARFAAAELRQMGPLSRAERIMLAVFVLVAGLWVAGPKLGLNATLVALTGVSVLLLSGLLTWEQALAEHPAWDVFIWFGGLVRMAEALNESGLMRRFAVFAASATISWPWWAALLALLVAYFYAHYAFASITAHASAMFVPFVTVSIAAGAPPFLVAASFALLTNLSATLTHYGTTPAPIYFGADYMSQATWWRLGLIVSFVTIPIFLVTGALWWKVLGYW
jgi:divalent anion:Na+ symporter, DASS family